MTSTLHYRFAENLGAECARDIPARDRDNWRPLTPADLIPDEDYSTLALVYPAHDLPAALHAYRTGFNRSLSPVLDPRD